MAMVILFDIDVNLLCICTQHLRSVAPNISLIIAIESKSIFQIFTVLFY